MWRIIIKIPKVMPKNLKPQKWLKLDFYLTILIVSSGLSHKKKLDGVGPIDNSPSTD